MAEITVFPHSGPEPEPTPSTEGGFSTMAVDGGILGPLPEVGQKPWNLNPALQVVQEELEGRLSPAGLNDTMGDVVAGLGLDPETAASSGFLRIAGTVPGSVPVVKPNGDTRAGVWEMTHNSATGYLFHLLSGASMSHTAALLGLGVDNDGIGIVIPNKKLGRGIVGDQRSTVTAPDAYWLHATQRSSAAPLVRLEMQANDAAHVLQLIAFGSPGPSQRLLYVSDPSGEAGSVYAADGKIRWQRTIRILNQSSGETASWLELSTSTASNSTNTRKAFHGAAEDVFFGATGAAGSYYPYRIARSGSAFALQTAANLTAADATNPAPSEVSTWTSHVLISHATGLTLGPAGGKVGFFGVTPVARPAAVADATDAATVITQLNALLARLRTIGLITA